MADTKISDLDPGTTPLAGTELVPIVQGGATVKVPASALGGDPLPLATDYSTTTPSAPTTGVKIFAQSMASRRRPAFVGPSGLSTSLQALLATNKIGWWSAQGNGTTVALFNMANTATGTATTRNVANTNRYTMIRRIGYQVNTGSACGTRHGVLQFNRDAGFEYIAHVGVAAQPSSGFHTLFVGMVSVTGDTGQVGSGNGAGFGLRLVANAGGGDGWTVVSAALSADTPTTHTTLSTTDFPFNTAATDMWEIRLFCPPGGTEVGYSLTRLTGGTGQSVSGTITTALPASNVLLSPMISGRCQTANTGYGIDVVSQYIETDL